MLKTLRVSLLAGLYLSIFLCGYSFAAGSGAYRVDMPDARALAMGGAFVAVADSSAAVYYNSAGMTQLKQSEVSVGLSLIQPKEHVSLAGSGTRTKMQQDTFLIPNLFSVIKFSEKIALGIGATSSWGLGTEWAQDSFAKYVSTRTKLTNKDYLFSMAYKMNEHFSLGAGLVIDDSTIEKEKKVNLSPFGVSDGNVKLSADNVAAGFQVSGLYKLNDRHQFGFQYNSDIRRKYHGKVHLDDFTGAAQAYYGLSPNSSYETDVVSKSTLPQSVDLGYSYKPTDKLTLCADVVWMGWNSVKEEELAFPSETNANRLDLFNTGNPTNRDWHSAVSFALGTEYKAADRLRLRGGYYYHQSPIPQDTWDTSLPDANSHSVTTGFGYDVSKSLTLDFAYGVMFYNDRSINNNVGNSSGASIDGKYSQWINLAVITATYKF